MATDENQPKDVTPGSETIKVTVTSQTTGDAAPGNKVTGDLVGANKVAAAPAGVIPDTFNYVVRNLTAWRIGITAKQSNETLVILPPFGERPLDDVNYQRLDLEKWQNETLVAVEKVQPPTTDTRDLMVGCATLLVVVYVIAGVVFYLFGVDRDVQTFFWFVGAALAAVGGLILFGRWKPVRERLDSFQHWVAQLLRLLVITVIVIGLPGLVAVFFGDNLQPLVLPQFTVPRAQPALLALVLQWALIAAASILPIIVYFLFDRQKLKSLRESFYRQVIRLDPQMETLEDARQTYRPQVEEIYGPESGNSVQTLFMGTNVPILLATMVITVGWIITLPPVVASINNFTLPDLYLTLVPHLSALNFGFMGAYVFTLNMLLRRYVRSDLSPKVYTHITVRIFVVAVTVWALSALLTFGAEALGVTGNVVGAIYERGYALVHPVPAKPDSTTIEAAAGTTLPSTDVSGPLLLVLAFFVGFVPETGMTVIQKYLRNQPFLKNVIPSVQDSHPLDRLDGINVYYQSRLLEEGIENIQNLAHSDLIQLMLHTRIPMSILIDWVDQAILYLHLAELQPEDQAKQTDGPLSKLREYGIRTATDLLKAYHAAEDRTAQLATQIELVKNEVPKPDAPQPESPLTEAQKFLAILDENPDVPVHKLQVLIDALVDDEWLDNIEYWHHTGDVGDQMYTFEAIINLRAAKRNQTTVTVSVTKQNVPVAALVS